MSHVRKPHIDTIDIGRRYALVTAASIDASNFDAMIDDLARCWGVPSEDVRCSEPVDGLVTVTGDGFPVTSGSVEA